MSKRLWVVNASPIISLANIEHAHLLPDSCDQMIIPLCGTIGVIVVAKKMGIIPSVKPLLKRLIDVDFRIDDRLYQTALRLVGETS